MIKVNMHDAKSRLSELVKAVEEKGQTIALCRQGVPVAQINPIKRTRKINRLKGSSALKIKIAPGFDPTEPASEADWPAESR